MPAQARRRKPALIWFFDRPRTAREARAALRADATIDAATGGSAPVHVEVRGGTLRGHNAQVNFVPPFGRW